MARHGGIVMAVCRRLLADAHEAEDAFQATWLVLARKSSRNWSDSIAGWLYEVAHRVACKARGQSARRETRRRELAEMAVVTRPASPPRDQVDINLLQAEMARLPEKDRAVLALCYLEGKTHAEAARALNCPPGSMSKRLARARDLLRHRLLRQGMDAGAGGPGGIARVLVGRRRARGGAASDHPGRDPGRGRHLGGGGGSRAPGDRPGRRSIARDELREAETGPVPDPDARDLHWLAAASSLYRPGGRETHQGCLGQRGPEQTLPLPNRPRRSPRARTFRSNLPLIVYQACRWRNAARPGHDRVPCPQRQAGAKPPADQHSRWGCLVRAADGLRLRHRWGRGRRALGKPGPTWALLVAVVVPQDGSAFAGGGLQVGGGGILGGRSAAVLQSRNAQAGGRFLRRADRRCAQETGSPRWRSRTSSAWRMAI